MRDARRVISRANSRRRKAEEHHQVTRPLARVAGLMNNAEPSRDAGQMREKIAARASLQCTLCDVNALPRAVAYTGTP